MVIILLAVVVILSILDQLFNVFVLSHLSSLDKIVLIPNFLELVLVKNTGIIFGLFPGRQILFIVLVSIALILMMITLFVYENHNRFSYMAAMLVLAGGVGNLIDRIIYGYVIDYIHVLFFPPVFNFADCCVTIGIIFLLIHVITLGNVKEKRSSYNFLCYKNFM